MILKTILMLSLFIIPMIIINSGLIASTGILFILYIISGLGMAGIGMGIMHDAIHGSYSTNKYVNKYLGYTMNLIGANSTVWRIQHNVLHHTYTNIDQSDDDINPPSVLRFSPHAKKNWMHKFQHFYVWFFYALSTISWITSKDFVRINRYRKKGFFSKKNKELISLYIPMLVMPKKGKLSQQEKEEENGKEFKKLKCAHSAVESNINQLEHNGLNKCLDKGLDGFVRYTSIGVLSYNLHRLGTVFINQEIKKEKKKKRLKQSA